MGTLWNLSGQMAFTNAGVLAPGAKAYFYDANTTDPKTVYEDFDQLSAHPFPAVADGNGRWPTVFVPYGTYKYVLTTSAGAAIGATVDNIPNAAPAEAPPDPSEDAILKTGMIIFEMKDGTRDGFVRCNGRTIGSAASSATERANADCEDLFLYLWTELPDTTATVAGGRGASAAADWAADKRITTPSLRGVMPAGLATMGNTDSGNYTNVPAVSGTAIIAGSTLGGNTHTLTEAQLASHDHAINFQTGNESATHTHPISIASGNQSAQHSHTLTAAGTSDPGAHSHTITVNDTRTWATAANVVGSAGGAKAATGGGSAWAESHSSAVTSSGGSITASSDSQGAHTHTLTGSTDASTTNHTHDVVGNTSTEAQVHTHLVFGDTLTAGSGTAHNNTPLVMVGTFYIKL